MNRMKTTSFLSAVGVLIFAAGSSGCTARTDEAKGRTSAKLLAPRAVFTGMASAATTKTLGIEEWRIFRGKTQYVLTGYDADGRAVKGVSIGFRGKTVESKALIKGRLRDGSRFTSTYQFGGTATAGATPKKTSMSFVAQAVRDMVALRMGLKTSLTASAIPTGEACGGDMVKVMLNALQCVASANATGSVLAKQLRVKQCLAAADAAAKAAASCQNTGATAPEGNASDNAGAGGTTSTGSSTPKGGTSAPSKSGSSAGSKGGSSAGSKDSEQTSSTDAEGSAQTTQESADAMQESMDAQQSQQDAMSTQSSPDEQVTSGAGASDGSAQMEEGANDATSASEDQSCTSCGGTAADDVSVNDQNGEVSGTTGGGANDSSGDVFNDGAAAGSESGSESGGESGGDTGGSGEVMTAAFRPRFDDE